MHGILVCALACDNYGIFISELSLYYGRGYVGFLLLLLILVGEIREKSSTRRGVDGDSTRFSV